MHSLCLRGRKPPTKGERQFHLLVITGRQGIASSLLKEYLERAKKLEGVKRIALIAHEELIPLYAKVSGTS